MRWSSDLNYNKNRSSGEKSPQQKLDRTLGSENDDNSDRESINSMQYVQYKQ